MTSLKSLTDDLERELASLSPAHRVAFAALCSERLLPVYGTFSRMEAWGDAAVLRRGLDAVWNWLAGRSPSRQLVQDLIDACEAAAPDTEEFSSAYASAALNAAAAVVEALECCLDGSVEHAVQAATLSIDTIWMHVQARDGVAGSVVAEAKVLGDPAILRETRRQDDDLAHLKRMRTLDPSALKSLRDSSRGHAVLEHS